jgi:hypothetical protein
MRLFVLYKQNATLCIVKAVKKLFQIVQEKKPKNGDKNMKNASETKRFEKEYKRLQLELNKVYILNIETNQFELIF